MSESGPAPRFITFEGGEGAGKSTQIKHLSAALSDAGVEHILTREPGGAPGAEDIRKLLVEGETGRWDAVSETLLHSAARRDHLIHTVQPALAAGQWVVSDRFADSTLAYQGCGHGLPAEAIEALYEMVADGLRPDLTLILDVDVEAGLGRAKERAGAAASAEDRYERMDADFHQRLRDGFLEIAAKNPDRCVLLDGTADVETIAQDVRRIVFEKFGIG